MKLHYYPGCSLEGTAVEYDRSTRVVMAALGVELLEIEGWTCCGASAAEATPFSPLTKPAACPACSCAHAGIATSIPAAQRAGRASGLTPSP